MKREEHFARIRSNRKVLFQQAKIDESKRIAFYCPVTKGLPLRECDIVPEGRCLPSHENDRSNNDSDGRDCLSDTMELSMQSNNESAGSNIDLSLNNYDVNDTYVVNDDDDNHSTSSAYTYATVDTTATSESVQSIISMLQSETERRRRLLQRRRRAIRAVT